MRSIFSFLLLLFCCTGFCQSTGRPESTGVVNPVTVQKPVILSNRYYRQLTADPSNAAAWLHYYNWLNRTRELTPAEKQLQLLQTLQSSKDHIGTSWQYSLMNFIQSGKRNKDLLTAALNNTDDKAMVYPYAIHFAIITKNEQLLQEYARALNDIAPLSPALYEYHFNCLMSARPNAVIYAKGLTDLAPMAILQQVFGVRKDIRFRYYEQPVTDTGNAYICLSAGKEIIEAYPGAGYSGLLVKLSGKQTTKELQEQVSRFSFTRLQSLASLNEAEKEIYKNYLPSFILLYRACKTGNDPAAGKWKTLIEKIAGLTGSLDTVQKMMAE